MTHDAKSVQEHLSAAATHVAAAIEDARASRVTGITELFDLRDAIQAQEDQFKRKREGSI